jgi:hypothetical protein
MKRTYNRNLWIVVEVQSGVAVDAKAYRSETSATRRLHARAKSLNPEDDDIEVFSVRIPR